MKRLSFLALVFGIGALLGSPLRSFADFDWSDQTNGVANPVMSSACQGSGGSCIPNHNCNALSPAQSVWCNGMNVLVYSYQWFGDYTWGNCQTSTGTCKQYGTNGAPCGKVSIFSATDCTMSWGVVVVRQGNCSNG